MYITRSSAFTTNMRTHPSVVGVHAVALLRNLNIQRMEGKYCDCVIRQYLNPGKLYLAHKSVLAASSPVLASLLPNKSALLELQFPSTTTEVLGSLLEFIYTGKLPSADQDDSLMSAATYLQIEELQQALRNSRLDSSSESDCTVVADMKPTVKRKRSDQQQNKRNEPSPPHNSPFPLSCEVVPVICHAGNRRNSSLVSKTQTQINVFSIGSDLTREETDVSALEVTTGHGHILKQSYVNEEEEALNDSQPEEIKIFSAGSTGLDLPIVAPENNSDELHEELDEKSVIQSSGDVIPTHTVVCSEVQTKGQAENPIIEDFASDINSSSYDDRSPKFSTSKGSEGFSTLNQLDTDKDKYSKRHFTQQYENITSPKVCIPDDSKENTHESKFKDLGILKVSSAFHPKSDMAKYFLGASRLNLWNEAPSYSTIHPKSLDEVTLDENRHEIKGSVGNEMRMYQGQVCYRYLERQKPLPVQSSDSDDDGLCGTVPRSDPREGLDITAKGDASDFVLLDISAKRCPAGRPEAAQSQLGLMAPAYARPYQCPVCERAFSQRGSLNRHMRSHLGVRPYPCPQCPMTFSRQYRVMEHMRVHQRGCEDLQRTDT